MRNRSNFVEEGQKLGILTVGQLVYDVQSHPLFISTPKSYLQHGRLRECLCECGVVKLFSENVIATGQLRSCGCRRQRTREIAHTERAGRLAKKAKLRDLVNQIKTTQEQIHLLQTKPGHLRGTPEHTRELRELGDKLRSLNAKKAYYSRKISPQEVWNRDKDKVSESE